MTTNQTKEHLMAILSELRKTVLERTPAYVAVGATDLAVEKVRQATSRAVELRSELAPAQLQDKAGAQAGKAVEQAQHVPVLALNATLELAGKAQESYDALATRGHELVGRIQRQRATKELLDQASSTVARSKGAVTTARRAAAETPRAALATVTAGRRDVVTVAEVVEADVRTTGRKVRTATTPTKRTAKRSTATARKRVTDAERATKGAATSARKSATAAAKATKAAAAKVGD